MILLYHVSLSNWYYRNVSFQKYASFLLQRPYFNIATTYLCQIQCRDFLKAWVYLHLLKISAFIVNAIFKTYNHFCIPDWLPKGKVQVSDFNFDPAPPEMLATIYNQTECHF